MIGGSLAYVLLHPGGLPPPGVRDNPFMAGFFRQTTANLSLDIGVLTSFLFCFLALAANDMGSIQSMNEMLKAPEQPRRLTRGILVTGLANILAGFLGVIGPVNFSLSPGVIASTGCASRFTLIPAAALLGLISFSPAVIALLGSVPSVVIGCVLLFILCSQVAAGLSILLETQEGFTFESGLILGLPILLGTIIAFLPSATLAAFPAILRPILGNGFVVGVTAALILEHGVFKGK
jgi:xanthine/uracil permease